MGRLGLAYKDAKALLFVSEGLGIKGFATENMTCQCVMIFLLEWTGEVWHYMKNVRSPDVQDLFHTYIML